MPVDAAVERRRVFFALWPDAATTDRLDQLGKQAHDLCGGRRTRRDTLHMTLAFIGDVPVERIEVLRLAAARVTGASFSLHIDQLACWRHNHIVWAGCEPAPLPLHTLVGQIAERLNEVGLPLDVKDFVAHVTLLRNARCEAMPECTPLVWPVSEFVLAETCLAPEGTHYRIIDRWPLLQPLD